jgi:lipopolysaccharide transport system permease protein
MILNLYRHRGYILRTAWADVRHRYAGSAMGVVWNVLQPLAQIALFSLVFTKVMTGDAKPGEAPYVLYLCSALLPWTAFAETITRGTHAFTENAVYLRKLPIPEQVFSARTSLSAAFSLAISFSLLALVALLMGRAPTWHWLLLPVPLALFLGLGFGLGMLLGSVNVFIRDVGQIVPIVLMLGFWSVPICYRLDFLPPWMWATMPFNPAYPFLVAVRSLFLDAALPPAAVWPSMLAWACGATAMGYLALRKLRPELRDVM